MTKIELAKPRDLNALKDTQKAEIDALKAIYMDDYKDIDTTTAWKSVNAAFEFQLRLRPSSEELWEKVQVTLHFKLPTKYPTVVPTITLEQAKGLGTTHLNTLGTLLREKAREMIGEAPMIYELALVASDFISDSNSVNGPQTSLAEQRLQKEMQKKLAAEKKRKEANIAIARQRKEEDARIAKLLEDDKQQYRESWKAREEKRKNEREYPYPEGEGQLKLSLTPESKCEEQNALLNLGFGEQICGLGHVLPGEVTINKETFTVSAHVYNLNSSFYLTFQGERKLQLVRETLSKIIPLRHENLLPVYGYKITRYISTFLPIPLRSPKGRIPEDGVTLTVVQEYYHSNYHSLYSLLLNCGEIRQEKALALLLPLANVLRFLHNHGIIHKAINAHNLLIGLSNNQVKLGNASWYQRLCDMDKSHPWSGRSSSVERNIPDAWVCPRALVDTFAYDRPRDMWDAGVLFAQMLFGLDVVYQFSTPTEMYRHVSENTVARQILMELFNHESEKRATSARLVSILSEPSPTNTITYSTPSKIPFRILDAKRPDSPDQPIAHSPGHGPQGLFWQPKPTIGRYRSDFEELEFLGRGGGGQVVKARNKLDGNLYAVKKIKLPDDPREVTKILREVTIWSRMNHANIVRYHTSWVETEETPVPMVETESESGFTVTDAETSDDSEEERSTTDFDSDDEPMSPGNIDVDLGLDDLSDLDFASIGNSRSYSYPSIQFRNDDDLSRQTTASNTPEQSVARPAVQQTSKRVGTLYIQMEFVEKLTLREAIDAGVSEADAWRYVSQIIMAMRHFTSLNIIHRDLKPSNIFIDGQGNVRIGDFGLAVNEEGNDGIDGSNLHNHSPQESTADLTSGVGTSLYIAPESLVSNKLGRKGIAKYSNKVDMYSLGIVFFELWFPVRTGMERIQVIRDLRKPEIVFPQTWPTHKLRQHTEIIRRCLAHDPAERASPGDIFYSGLLPPLAGYNSMEETLRLLAESSGQHSRELISALFAQSVDDRIRKDFSFDQRYDGAREEIETDAYGDIVKDKLAKIFRLKGAMLMDSPLLMPDSDIYGNRKVVKLLDPDGTVTCLPGHLNIPFCRVVARDRTLIRLKRWTVAPIYRPRPGGGQPQALMRAAFDIVSDVHTLVAEAEVIATIDEIIAAFPFTGETLHFLNHTHILDALLTPIPKEKRQMVLDVLRQHTLTGSSWKKMQTELLKVHGVLPSMIESFAIFIIPAEVDVMKERVLSVVSSSLKSSVEQAFEELEETIFYTRKLGVKHLLVGPLIARNHDFHRGGILFETVKVSGKTRLEIAAGGRFDEVITRLAPPDLRQAGRLPHVVGFSLDIGKLSDAVCEWNATTGKTLIKVKPENMRGYGPWAARRCDVYVVSFGPNLLNERVDIVRDLWAANIKADISYEQTYSQTSQTSLFEAWQREGINWVVIVKGSSRASSTGLVKVRHLLRPIEEEVSRTQLVSWLQSQMHKEDNLHNLTVETNNEIHVLSSDLEVHAVIEGDRLKGRKYKTMMVDHAAKNVEETILRLSKAPVIAVDIEDAAFEKISKSSSWVENDDAYKSIVNALPSSKRDYLMMIRNSIKQEHGSCHIWLFGLRQNKSSLLEWKP